MAGKLFSLEGISGTGKTFLMKILTKELEENQNIIFIKKIFDEVHVGLDKQIFLALYHTGDKFFDMGVPLTETMLLLSRFMYQYESVINKSLNNGKIVVEDRGIDTVALAQAIIINKKYEGDVIKISNDIYEFAKKFIRLPDKTFLLCGDPEFAIKRAEQRDNQLYTSEEKEILKKVEQMYILNAEREPERFIRFDIHNDKIYEIVKKIKNEILN
jgi:dTMP kinase